MKAFVCAGYSRHNPSIGLSKKLNSQIETLERLGYEVTYTAYSDEGVEVVGSQGELLYSKSFGMFPRKAAQLLRRDILFCLAIEYLKHSSELFDLGFVRWGAIDGRFLSVLEEMKKHCSSIVMDCHGWHRNYTGTTIKSRYIEFTTKRNSHKLGIYINACMTETKETSVFGIPALPMDTCIDVWKYKPHFYTGPTNTLSMICVADEKPYHGLDRVVKGISAYPSNDVHLHLVGKISMATTKLIAKLGVQDRVTLHGYLSGTPLDNVYEICNMGIGPLAPHRTGGKEGTGIKTKEYFAIGLPYFYAGRELIVPEDYPYALRISDDDGAVDIARVYDFCNTVSEIVGYQIQMRDFAREHFSWERVLSQTIELGRLEQ